MKTTYVVYHAASTMEKKLFKSAALALAYAEKLNVGKNAATYAAATKAYYDAYVVKMVEKKNLMSGETYLEASNTPLYLSAASETYWSA